MTLASINEGRAFSRLSPVNRPPAAREAQPQDGFTPSGDTQEIQASKPTRQAGTSRLTKAVIGTSLAVSAFTGLAPSAHAAVSALVQMQPKPSNGLNVIVLPNNTPRLDIFNAGKRGINRDVDPKDYSQVGLDLGNGLFQDTHGNLSVVPYLAYDWNVEASDFQRVDMGVKGQSIERFGGTVQFSESSTKREIYSESGAKTTLTGPHGKTVFERMNDGSISVTTQKDRYTIRQDGMFTRIQRAGKADINIMRSEGEIRVIENNRAFAGSSLKADGSLTTISSAGETTSTRSESGTIINIDGKKGLRDATIIRDGTTFLGGKDRDRMNVNDQRLLDEAKARYQDVMSQLEQVEPGFEQKHPIVAEVLQYAAANPRLLTDDHQNTGFMQAGTLLATTSAGAKTVTALGLEATAINMANSARALGAAALAAKAAAQAQAAAGNLAQAASLAQDAQNFAAQANAAKDNAIRTGGKAMKSANLARVLAGVGGALEIVNGVMNIKEGKGDRALIQGARAVTENSMERWSQVMTGADRVAVQDDYDKVMKVMDQLDKQADKKVRVGTMKIGLGGLMVVSALLGPEAPPILGAIGVAGTVGVTVYEHWGPIKSFLTGESNKVPTFLDILPNKDEVIIHLDGKPQPKPR
ncbi:MAG: hypothetical protein KF760_35070 [Candidatus Eremiobacteraeota bacterium]|nr:hypothetical protein [Candidatus Eremiobacteraeota bacterium]MCW5870859.1 hypothetical protein [Candidatus Eremiobacteraeota bacterium]